MKSTLILGGFAILLMTGSVATASPWSDSVITALTQENQAALEKLQEKGKSRAQASSDFSDVAAGLKGRPGWKGYFNHFALDFEHRLGLDFKDASFGSYGERIVDTTVPVEARKVLLRTMVLSKHKVSLSLRDSIAAVLKRLLIDKEPSIQMKVMALHYLGHVPTEAGCAPFTPFLSSSDTALREAAYQGLGKKILVNRTSDNRNRNGVIFDELTQMIPGEIIQQQVKVIALIGEGYSRSYLLSKCSGNTEKIRTVFLFDTRVDNVGLIKEAVRLMKTNGQGQVMGKAIVYGVGEPANAVNALLGGASTDVETGLQLLKLFPDHVPQHEASVRTLLGSQDQGVRQAAEALTAFLPSSNATAE